MVLSRLVKSFTFDATPEFDPTKVIVNFVIFLVVLIGTIILFWKLKFNSIGYKRLFIFYTLFWFPLMLVRSYRGALNTDLEVDQTLLWIPLTVYGLAGILIRPLFDFMGAYFYSRKSIVYFSLWLQLLCFIPVVVYPSFATNVIQAIGVGLGASCISTFSLWFNEQHARQKPFLTISILSLPPLLADFISSPIQTIIRTTAPYGRNNLQFPIHADPHWTVLLWIIAIVVILISFVFAYFVPEQRSLVGLSKDQNKPILKTKWDVVVLVGIILVGAAIDFTKFATADAIAVNNLHMIGNGAINTRFFDGYVTAIFSVAQLLGGILMGLLVARYLSKIVIYLIGSSFFIAYNIGVVLVVNHLNASQTGAISFLLLQSLNGFGYGILYNLLIAHILSYGFKTKKFSPLGLYQSFAAMSIAAGTFFSATIKTFLNTNLKENEAIISYSLIGILVLMGFVYYLINFISTGFKNKPLWTITKAGNLVQ